MRLEKYLAEQDFNIYEGPVRTWLGEIERECSQIIKIYKKTLGYLWRGISRYSVVNQAEIKITNMKKPLSITPRTAREPKDMPWDIHEFLDTLFKKYFGWNVRSEGVFTTTSRRQAGTFGTPVVVFPVDGFKYVYHPQVGDLFSHMEDEHLLLPAEDWAWETELPKDKDPFVEQSEAIEDLVKGFKSTSLASIIRDKMGMYQEIAIKCKKYYILPNKFEGTLTSILG